VGASLRAYIEYDDAPEYYTPGAVPVPFARETDRVIDLTTDVGITRGKDDLFMGAIGGPRNPRGVAPLFWPRRLPPRVNWRIARAFDPADGNTGWLLLPEIEAAMAHAGVELTDVSFGVEVMLGIMRLLVKRLGPERARLVFQMSD
jgi:hypothetical protein